MGSRFNGYLKAVIVRVSEAHDLGEFDRFSLYDRLKAYEAAPPDVLRVDEKHIREHAVLNVCGVIITTNHKTDGVYLPADDRRHDVCWSDCCREDFAESYWRQLYEWYDQGGIRNVAAYLASLDISVFDPKAPPPKTTAFWEIVNSSRPPEDAELADALDRLQRPDAVTLQDIISRASEEFAEWLRDRRNSRAIPHRLEECGYVAVRNPAANDGLWRVNGKRQAIYGKAEQPIRDRHTAATHKARQRCR
jgi:hypothetical protein